MTHACGFWQACQKPCPQEGWGERRRSKASAQADTSNTDRNGHQGCHGQPQAGRPAIIVVRRFPHQCSKRHRRVGTTTLLHHCPAKARWRVGCRDWAMIMAGWRGTIVRLNELMFRLRCALLTCSWWHFGALLFLAMLFVWVIVRAVIFLRWTTFPAPC